MHLCKRMIDSAQLRSRHWISQDNFCLKKKRKREFWEVNYQSLEKSKPEWYVKIAYTIFRQMSLPCTSILFVTTCWSATTCTWSSAFIRRKKEETMQFSSWRTGGRKKMKGVICFIMGIAQEVLDDPSLPQRESDN